VSTAQTLINNAAYAIGVLGQADASLSTADSNLGLSVLQRMLDSWANDGLLVYSRTQETISLTAGDGTYTTANLSTASRPVAIHGGFVRYGGTDYPLRRVEDDEWNSIAVKTTQGIPEVFTYEPKMTGEFEFYPVPVDAMTAYLDVQRPLTATLALSDNLSLPPGYEDAIVENLAVKMAFGGFGVVPSPYLLQSARKSLKLLRTTNYRPGILTGATNRRYDINGDE
jgi:hypothetical protein